MKTRITALFTALFLMFVFMSAPGRVFAINEFRTNKDYNSFYINNSPWESGAQYGWIKLDADYYVPFNCLMDLEKLTIIDDVRSGLLRYIRDTRYLAFDTMTKEFVYTSDGTGVFMRTYLLHDGVLRVPAKYVAEFFGYRFDTYTAADGREAIRIGDSTAAPFLEVIGKYQPDLMPESERPVVTEPVVPVKPVEVIGERTIYLTFDDAPNEYTGEILDILNNAGIKATFFLRGDRVDKYPEEVRRMIAGGHSIGMQSMTGNAEAFQKDFSVFMDELKIESALLRGMFRTSTRIIRAPDGSSSDRLFIDEERGKQLDDAGYVVWDWNVFSADLTARRASNVSDAVIAGIKRYDIPVIRMHSCKRAIEALPAIIEYIKSNRDFKTAAITPAAANISFVGIKFN